MSSVWREIRSVLELQRALTGRRLPVSARQEADSVSSPPSGVEAGSAVDVSDASSDHSKPSVVSTTEPPTTRSSPMPTRNLFDDQLSSGDMAETPYERIEALISEDSPIRDIDTLEALRKYVETTILVPVDEERQNAVFGVGAADADLVIVGEAPGAQEDKQGEPFVGRAGQLLDKILEAIDFKRKGVYITNILKSRPPKNRNPRPAEIEAHIPVLYKQLALIKPKLILCVGKVAGNTLLDRSSTLGSMRGKFHDFHGLPTMVTYHPAALLRNPQWKRPTWEDVKLLRARYDELTGES